MTKNKIDGRRKRVPDAAELDYGEQTTDERPVLLNCPLAVWRGDGHRHEIERWRATGGQPKLSEPSTRD